VFFIFGMAIAKLGLSQLFGDERFISLPLASKLETQNWTCQKQHICSLAKFLL